MTEAPLIHQDQSASELRLSLIEGKLDKKQFCILAEKTMDNKTFFIEAAVIGASHAISISCAGHTIHEVFACVDVENPGKRAFYGPLDKVIGETSLSLCGKFDYRFEAKLHEWDNGLKIASMIEEDGNGNKKNVIGLNYSFPAGEDNVKPKTVVFVTLTKAGVLIKTVHEYPNEKKIVITRSKLTLHGGEK